MKTITIQDIRKHGAKGIDDNDVTYLIVNSKLKCAMVPIEYFKVLEDLLEEQWAEKAYEERKDEPDIPAEKAFKKLDL